MATRTLILSGNISSGAAFDVAPISTDDIVIPAGFYLVIDVNKTFNSITVESLAWNGLTVNAKLTANVIVGNGSAKDGQLTFGQGCEIAGSITFNNCKVRSTATTSAWAKVTGSGSVKSGTVYTSPKQDFAFSYVSFQNTGECILDIYATSGAASLTPQCDCPHNTFVGNSIFSIG